MMPDINDKELLAISCLAGLRLEFADIGRVRDDTTKEILEYHTIFSLLNAAREAILKRKENEEDNKEDNIFWGLTDDGTHLEERLIYTDITQLKKDAGIIYEYFEKFAMGNEEGAFTDDWEILWAGDNYSLLEFFFKHFVEPAVKNPVASFDDPNSGTKLNFYLDSEDTLVVNDGQESSQ